MRRPEPRSMEEVCREARRIVVIDSVVDATNIGAIFRSAAALGIDAVLLTRNLRSIEPPCGQGINGSSFLCAMGLDERFPQ